MSEHIATLLWSLGDADFDIKTFSRNHQWDLGHGLEVSASSAPDFGGDETRCDPEQAFVAALSSCHMLTFLAIASLKKLKLLSYEDRAIGHLEKNDKRQLVITRVDLYPKMTWDGPSPSPEQLEEMHHKAHTRCFLANSVNCEILTHLE